MMKLAGKQVEQHYSADPFEHLSLGRWQLNLLFMALPFISSS